MKIALVSLDSRFNHVNPAVRILCRELLNAGFDARILELTVNEQIPDQLSQLFESNADHFAFSSYIWNIERVLPLARDLKKLLPGSKMILGGPEVSYDPERLFAQHNFIDFIMCGEGEKVITDLFSHIEDKRFDFDAHLYYAEKKGETIPRRTGSFQEIAPAYEKEELSSLKNRLVYYETSRGCPFSCSYCLSSEERRVIFKDLGQVKKELLEMIHAEIPVVKLTDRTFNCDAARAYEIFSFLLSHPGKTTFHFEICADLLDEKTLALLKKAPPGLFRFEIGVQSVSEETLVRIGRKSDVKKTLAALKALKAMGNIELHADLIAGLPGDTKSGVGQGIDALFFFCDMLQLGFLKLLKGTKMRFEADRLGFLYSSDPPYEVFASDKISYPDMLRLKRVAEVIGRYKNGGRFSSLEWAVQKYGASPFYFLSEFAEYLHRGKKTLKNTARKSLYELLYRFLEKNFGEDLSFGGFETLLAGDFILNEKCDPPEFLKWDCGDLKTKSREFWADEATQQKLFSLAGGEIKKAGARIYPVSRREKKFVLFSPEYDKIFEITEIFCL